MKQEDLRGMETSEVFACYWGVGSSLAAAVSAWTILL